MNADRVIGLNGDLPWHYSADLKRFKRRTLDSTIVMGRLTWESIGAKPLPQRRNIVLTSREIDGVETMPGVDALLENFAGIDLWFIGGGQIYAAVMDDLNLLDVTIVPDEVNAESVVRFPVIDPATWELVSDQPLDEQPALRNLIYQRRS